MESNDVSMRADLQRATDLLEKAMKQIEEGIEAFRGAADFLYEILPEHHREYFDDVSEPIDEVEHFLERAKRGITDVHDLRQLYRMRSES